MSTVIKIENLSKVYRLGMIGSHTVFDDIKRTWAGISRKKDPAKLSIETNIRKKKSKGQYVWALKDISLEVN